MRKRVLAKPARKREWHPTSTFSSTVNLPSLVESCHPRKTPRRVRLLDAGRIETAAQNCMRRHRSAVGVGDRDLTLPRLVQLRHHAGSHTTLPWREMDSNFRSPRRARGAITILAK